MKFKNVALLTIIFSIALLGIVHSFYFLVITIISNYSTYVINAVGILILMAVALLSNYQPIEMPQHGQVTVSSGIFFACMLLFGKGVAIIVAFLSILIVSLISGVSNLKELIYKFSYPVVSILFSGLVFEVINRGGTNDILLMSWMNVLAIFVSMVVYFFLDTCLSSLFVSSQEGINFRHVYEWHWGEIYPYYFSLLPLGVIVAVIYKVNFPVSSLFIIFPLFIIERIHNAVKLQALLGNVPAVVQSEANKEVEAVVVKTEQVRKEIEKKNREMEILLQTSQALSGTLKLEDTFEIIKDKIQLLVACQTCIIFLQEEIEGEPQLVAKSVAGPYSEYVLTVKSFPISSTETIIGWVASEKKSCVIHDTESQTNPPPMIRYERSEMAVPLLSKDECIGIIYVGQQKANSFNHDDLNLLSTLANQAAISITSAQLYEKTHNMATTDGLTGLYTHRTFQEKIQEEIQKAKRYKTCMSLIMVDTDHFKQYNDSYGHPEGDVLLKEICKLLKSYVRGTDIVCRYGGDEFCLILVEADKKTAVNTAERIRQAIQLRLNQREVKITASIGVAAFPEDATNKEELIKNADASLYDAKKGGRNKVCYQK